MKIVTFKITNENYYKMLFVCELSGFNLKDYLNEHLTHVDFNGARAIADDHTKEYKEFKKVIKKLKVYFIF